MLATWWHWSDVSVLWLAAMLRDIYLVKAVVRSQVKSDVLCQFCFNKCFRLMLMILDGCGSVEFYLVY